MKHKELLPKSLIINVCFPRSGHRFLRELLLKVFGSSFKCVPYNPEQVSSLTQQQQMSLAHANYIKSHDFALEGPAMLNSIMVENRRYLLQVRHTLLSIISYYEFALKHGDLIEDSPSSWQQFMHSKLAYWRGFVDTWRSMITENNPRALAISYEDLTDDPYQALLKAVEFVSASKVTNTDFIHEALDKVYFMQYSNDPTSLKSSIRQPEQFRYFDLKQFSDLEASLVDEYLIPLAMDVRFS